MLTLFGTVVSTGVACITLILPIDFICISYDVQNRQIFLLCDALTSWSFEWGLFSEVLSELRSYILH
jgi:hypothetical protein